MNKIDAYIGFCIKKGCAVLGVDGIEVCRRKVHLILFSNDLGGQFFEETFQVCVTAELSDAGI